MVIQNKSTQARELLSIEMPQQPSQRMFALKAPAPSMDRPTRLPAGGTHTQGIKFSGRGVQDGTFRHTLIFNFSTWVLEYRLTITVAAPEAVADLHALRPVSEYRPKALPKADEPERHLVPAFPPNRICTLPGGNLYTATLENAGPHKPDAYPLPPNIVDTVEGVPRPRRSSSVRASVRA